MNRVLFDQYDIEDQNHDFLVSKHHFTTALKEKLALSSDDDLNIPPASTYNQWLSFLTLIFSEEHFVERRVERNVELLYYPNLPISTQHVEISLYKVSMLNNLEFDADKMFYTVKRKLRNRKIGFDVNEEYNCRRTTIMGIPTTPIKDKIELSIYPDHSSVELIWEIIKVLEEDCFRTIEKSDIIS